MLQIRLLLREKGSRLWLRRHTRLVVALIVGIGCLVDAGFASAADAAASQVRMTHFPVAQIFTFLFLMLGPFKIIAPFSMVPSTDHTGKRYES